ncbi:uncharacterized protein B0J16DRAFT_323809 [Fusarium flagelliforme]|uniref:uncharacterized protein n=1 Tax=Fusarium flagelliforme TaxID=2675880 RepID=UPI001E8DFEA8|nr:uncharacterized protein B0J16DRAFT_323809 [Fusarium flagelliforme]KAH7174350.1 hypothetical protein B0J16DRAFT_323809 [Fusarium flagelliforme]
MRLCAREYPLLFLLFPLTFSLLLNTIITTRVSRPLNSYQFERRRYALQLDASDHPDELEAVVAVFRPHPAETTVMSDPGSGAFLTSQQKWTQAIMGNPAH